MQRFKAVVEYDGTAYHGWQLQKDLPTIQGEMERALERIVRVPTRVHGAGRTDAGVHALGQVAHFDITWRHSPDALLRACNALLPADIVTRKIELVTESFHARHSARTKTYVYTILSRPVASPLARLYMWHIPDRLDVRTMNRAAEHLLGSHDFAAFGSPTDGTPSTVREIREAHWEIDPRDEILSFSIRGTGFLRYMVRSLVGTMVLVGRGKMSPDDFSRVLGSRNRSLAGPTAPSRGLCLTSVEYDDVYRAEEGLSA
ncbi:MAG: tRNA pseudouridine(38-40) synthase TruA [Thermodesulfobacteriota bacterium]